MMVKDEPQKQKVLFICTENAARSQMAEGIMRAMLGDRYEAYSAGVKPDRVSPFAIRTLAEKGIDISQHRSKSIDEFKDKTFDYVITVCDRARETCPFFPGGKHILHAPFNDPAATHGSDEEILKAFRIIRDQITSWIRTTFEGTDS